MANLVIDIGNSYTKAAIFNFDELLWVQSYSHIDTNIINQLLTDYQPGKAIVSSVKKQYTEPWLQSLSERVLLVQFNAGMPASIKNHYRTPTTLGLDRLAAVGGAYALYPGKGNMVIDAGTCITYDWVDEQGNYFGGSISPGINMRYQALNKYTAALPLIEKDPDFKDTFGYDTVSAIKSGVQNGIRFEVMGFIETYFKTHQALNILLSGGDAIFFDTLLKNSIFAPYVKLEPHLVLKGLNAVIQHHND